MVGFGERDEVFWRGQKKSGSWHPVQGPILHSAHSSAAGVVLACAEFYSPACSIVRQGVYWQKFRTAARQAGCGMCNRVSRRCCGGLPLGCAGMPAKQRKAGLGSLCPLPSWTLEGWPSILGFQPPKGIQCGSTRLRFMIRRIRIARATKLALVSPSDYISSLPHPPLGQRVSSYGSCTVPANLDAAKVVLHLSRLQESCPAVGPGQRLQCEAW